MSTIGATAPSQHTINYDALLSTTLFAFRPKMVDNIFKSSGFLALLRSRGAIEYQNGGERIAQPLMYEKNTTVKSYHGYEQLDTTPQDGMTTAFYPWCEIGGTIAILTRKERPYPPGLKKPPQVEYTFTPFPLSCSVCEEFVMADLYRKKE